MLLVRQVLFKKLQTTSHCPVELAGGWLCRHHLPTDAEVSWTHSTPPPTFPSLAVGSVDTTGTALGGDGAYISFSCFTRILSNEICRPLTAVGGASGAGLSACGTVLWLGIEEGTEEGGGATAGLEAEPGELGLLKIWRPPEVRLEMSGRPWCCWCCCCCCCRCFVWCCSCCWCWRRLAGVIGDVRADNTEELVLL